MARPRIYPSLRFPRLVLGRLANRLLLYFKDCWSECQPMTPQVDDDLHEFDGRENPLKRRLHESSSTMLTRDRNNNTKTRKNYRQLAGMSDDDDDGNEAEYVPVPSAKRVRSLRRMGKADMIVVLSRRAIQLIPCQPTSPWTQILRRPRSITTIRTLFVTNQRILRRMARIEESQPYRPSPRMTTKLPLQCHKKRLFPPFKPSIDCFSNTSRERSLHSRTRRRPPLRSISAQFSVHYSRNKDIT